MDKHKVTTIAYRWDEIKNGWKEDYKRVVTHEEEGPKGGKDAPTLKVTCEG
jgi:hypothetical protein